MANLPPKEIQCPNCEGQVLTKKEGKLFSSISGFVSKSFGIRIPTGLLSFVKSNTPVSKQKIFKDKCPVCNNTRKIPNPSYKTATAAQKVASNIEAKAEEIANLESKLAPACGNRYTIIQGCDLLEVGLGMNDFPSYRVDKEGDIRNKGLIDPSKINTKEGGPQIPEGAKCNHVEGLNPLASPGGHYMIKCSNKFTVVVGAQGIDINTKGPLTINAGITRITGPELTIGTQTGKLVLEGETVNLNGKSVEVTPSDGHFFVKGTISNTGNIMVGGHTHSESVSFVKAQCPGKNDVVKMSAPTDLFNGPAKYSARGAAAALKDLKGFALANTTNPQYAQQVTTPRFGQGLNDKIANVAYNSLPYEPAPSGIILPGTFIQITGSCPCNQGGTAGGTIQGVVTVPIPFNNFPHVHALPDANHSHEVRVPAIDFSADTAEAVRGKVAGVSSPAPLQVSDSKAGEALLGAASSIGAAWSAAWGSNSKSTYTT